MSDPTKDATIEDLVREAFDAHPFVQKLRALDEAQVFDPTARPAPAAPPAPSLTPEAELAVTRVALSTGVRPEAVQDVLGRLREPARTSAADVTRNETVFESLRRLRTEAPHLFTGRLYD